jgi:Cu-processing system permease protein
MLLLPDFLVGLRIAIRARYVFIASISLCVLLLSAWLSSQFSGRQPATVALDIGLSVMRLVLPLVLVLIVQEVMSREFDRRYFLNSIAYPRPRSSFMLGRFLAILVLLWGLLCLMALALGGVVWWVGLGYDQATHVSLGRHYALVIFFIGVDLLVLSAMASMLAVMASTPSFVLIGTLGFMLVARSFASIIELLTRDAWVVGGGDEYRQGISVLSYMLPDLGALDIRMVALYSRMEFLPGDWFLLLMSNLAYVLALVFLGVWHLWRKKFS